MRTNIDRRNWTALFAAALLLTALTHAVGAAESGLYLKLDGGANFIPGTDLEIYGLPGHLSLDPGYRVDGIIGYRLNHWLAAEFEGGFSDNSIDSVSLEGVPGRFNGRSYLRQIPLLVNLVARYDNPTSFTPYIGAGAGGVVSLFELGGTGDEDVVFAAQAKVGLIYKIEEQAWIDISYAFLGTANQNFNLGGAPFRTDRVFSHFFGASITWNF